MSVVLLGSTSGSITLQEPAVAGTNTVNFGANTGVAILDANTPAFRNRIINGAMVIDQRNAGASSSNPNGYLLDRWNFSISTNSKMSAQQNQGSVTPPTGFSNYLGITSSSAYSINSNDYFFVSQYIEGFNTSDLAFGTASAQAVTVSFWVRSSLTGTFGGSLQNSAQNRNYPFTYTISSANTWEQKTITVAGDTTGTWIGATNGIGLRINFGLGVGSNFSGTAGAWNGSATANWSATGATSVVGTNGATFYITGVQLEKGSTATSFDYRPYGTELALCQRYYYKQGAGQANYIFNTGYFGSTTTANLLTFFPVTMRTNPSALEQTGTAGDYKIFFDGTSQTCSAVPSFEQASNSTGRVTFTVSSGGTVGRGVHGVSVNTSAFLAWSAEL